MQHRQLILTPSGFVRFDDPMLDVSYPRKEGAPSLREQFVKVEDLSQGVLLAALYQVVQERDRYRNQLERVKQTATIF